ncbi:MAG: oxygen-independent coproporphyrinogen III oxidase [Candidatus Sumerlaeota bacterium]|nr:oxygen-independent coproporphyrinogen III oxidase [Candidatus Sumerlaeota bacterium]
MSTMAERMPLTAELIRKYDRPGPRYTSYPTAVEFSERYGPDDYEADLAEADRDGASPLSLYVHLPFCEARCAFCACNVIITRNRAATRRYLDALERETELVAARLPHRRGVAQLHFGGGTPTYQTPAELRRLHRAIARQFEIQPQAEVAIEVDPCVTTEEHMSALRDMGFNRLSMGVQDLTPEVQREIRRDQTVEETVRLFGIARALGFTSINVDLVYGLPRQRAETFERSLDQVIAMRPERVALYSFAYLPWMKKNQALLDPSLLPSPEVKLELFVRAMDKFLGAGYVKIGMDHFAVPEDDLARALEDRRLARNFMGYTVRPTNATIALGVSSIGELQGNSMQNTKKLNRYHEAIGAGRFATERGYRMTPDDRIRRDVIQSVMCNFYVDFAEIERRFGIDARAYFAVERPELDELERGDFLRRDGKRLYVVGLGQLFVRNVAMVFDAHLRAQREGARHFSRTV